ncbi:response regulator transcription factor [Exiguobacterium sp. s162]|uniref:response regulator transcription factor n=1 Tax=Exiguobacterium sp. s162 TaxID=2751276 RepID=UPI001BE704C1|nr:response regulator transcription factor [Exiguobacterium sp. s162]
MEEIKLMIVDDQELIRSSLSMVLATDDEITVVGTAQNGKEAIDVARLTQPDVILMDINMPVMNGIDATKYILSHEMAHNIIILTTFQEMEYVLEALQVGASGYLLKAIDTKDLIAGIKLVHRGGTLINHDVAKILFTEHLSGELNGVSKGMVRYQLSQREQEVLKCLAQGLTNQDISEKLFLSMGTVKNYVSRLYDKLDVANRIEAIQKASREKLL